MAGPRDYARERARRIALHPGDRTAARGHARTPEHPERVRKQPQRYQRYQRYIARQNQRRMGEGLAPLEYQQPPPIAPRQVRGQVDTLAEAERRTQGVPAPYVRIYIVPGGYVFEIDRRESRRARAA